LDRVVGVANLGDTFIQEPDTTMRNQCEAVTQPSTYSQAHRCLKKAAKRILGRKLCSHHVRANMQGATNAKLN